MSQFKPMVKMMTDEPSVILKLKKGGGVKHKAVGGFMPMAASQPAPMGMPARGGMAPVAAPMRPSMAARRAAMNPNMMKKGGKAESKHEKHEEHEIHKLEKELKHHEHEKDSKHGGKAHAKHGGKIHHKASGGAIDRDETKTTIEKGAKKFENTKVDDGQHHDKHHGTKGIKDGAPAGYKHGGHAKKMHKFATGGAIPADTDEKVNKGKIKMKGTIEGNEHDYVNTEMHEAKRDRAHGTKGIKESNAGGFKRGGKVPGIGRAIEHDGDWENRPADTAKAGKMNGTTGGVRESNAGGFKHGGHAAKKHYATGGDVDMGQADRTLRQSSRGEHRLPDHRALNKAAKQMGYEHYMDVPDSRLKEFHELKKTHGYAKGGNVVDDGKAVKMPRHFVSRPVANSLQSGTFKKGGKVHHHSKGGLEFSDEDDRSNMTPQMAQDAKLRALQTKQYNKDASTPPAPTQKQSIHSDGYRKGGKAKC